MSVHYYTLSHRIIGERMGPAQGCLNEFEDVLVEALDARSFSPQSERGPQWLPGRFQRERLSLATTPLLEGTPSERVLFVIVINPQWLRILEAFGNWRRQFGIVAAYVFDSFEPGGREWIGKLDHLFVPMMASIPPNGRTERTPTTFLPMACDVRKFGSGVSERQMDVIGYGRQDRAHVEALAARFNARDSGRIFYHTTLRSPAVTGQVEHRRLFWQMLRSSKIALAYDAMTTGQARFHCSFVAQRWFEALTAGCLVVGRRPTCPEVGQLLDWEDATIDLSDDPQKAVHEIELLLEDEARLKSAHKRNHQKCLLRHDWRNRIQTMLAELSLPLPSKSVVLTGRESPVI